jgi:unsaturated chondroitin disaccharide hydrolase
MPLQQQDGFVQDALAYSLEQIQSTLATVDTFPEFTEGDHWACFESAGWTGRHWTGLLWLAYLHSADKTLEAAARTWTMRLAPRQDDTATHDLGFLFKLSYVQGAKLTGDAALKPPALHAARTLTRRFSARGRFLQAWGALNGTPDERGRTIIDAMMNLDLLFWATRETGEQQFADIAVAHARTARRRQVRADGTTAHTAEFNPDTGEFINQDTHQGFSAPSCWSRGQSWAVYSFTECYRETGDSVFLETARHLADYALGHLPPDNVPYWDYNSPLIPDDVCDSSAAAIQASALLMLAQLEDQDDQAARWRAAAQSILQSLWENYSSRQRLEPSILTHGTRHKPFGSMDHELIYGDYYFVEALTRLLQPNFWI